MGPKKVQQQGVGLDLGVQGLSDVYKRQILMIPACFLGGAAFCLFCDGLARTVFAPTELSISAVTAVLGAPIVIWIMLRRRLRPGE